MVAGIIILTTFILFFAFVPPTSKKEKKAVGGFKCDVCDQVKPKRRRASGNRCYSCWNSGNH